jgi:septal ring factor EnvC (AmiA/AmiB activator)
MVEHPCGLHKTQNALLHMPLCCQCLLQAREEQIRAKAEKHAAELTQLQREREEAEAQAEREAAAHERKMAAIKQRSKATQDELLGQIYVSVGSVSA